MQLTENISLKELVFSKDAERLGIDNKPNEVEIQKLTTLAKNILQPVRTYFGKPIIISSGFRCKELNAAIGGEPNSQHVKAEAVDFVVKDVPLKDVFLFISQNLNYDQLIYEFKRWIHCSYKTNGNRKQRLIASKINSTTVYSQYIGIHQL
ncbi:MAG: hypothetical protein KGZ42_07555 [Melioribacter sp.]|nr:hypothetical protein [Melioribacter sp.]